MHLLRPCGRLQLDLPSFEAGTLHESGPMADMPRVKDDSMSFHELELSKVATVSHAEVAIAGDLPTEYV